MALVDEKQGERFIEEPINTNETTDTASTSASASASERKGDIYRGCATPETVFAVATSFSYFLAENLNRIELETLLNILSLIVSNISAIITQIEICKGESVVSLPE